MRRGHSRHRPSPTGCRGGRVHGAAIPVLPVVDALKQVTDGVVTGTPDRATMFRAQTPQGARRELLAAAIEAYADGPDVFRDEQELLARHGVAVVTVPGRPTRSRSRSRPTWPGPGAAPAGLGDAELPGGAELEVRYALGADSHPFGSLDGLRLAGLDIPDAPRLHGHSDGDAALHAVCDGLLAAGRMGDLGRLFPS